MKLASWKGLQRRYKVAAVLVIAYIVGHLCDVFLPQPLSATPALPAKAIAAGGGSHAPLHHLVMATQVTPQLDLMLASSKRFGFTTKVLGLGDSKPFGHGAGNWGYRLTLFKEAAAKLPPDDWVVITDAYDVVWQRPAAYVLATLEAWEAASGKKLLFCAEHEEWPDVGQPYKTRHKAFPFLNAGIFAGRAKNVLAAVAGGYTENIDDQRMFTQHYLGNVPKGSKLPPGSIDLDHDAQLFGAFSGLRDREYTYSTRVEDAAVSGATKDTLPAIRFDIVGRDAIPAALHFNGGVKTHFFSVARYLYGRQGADAGDAVACGKNLMRDCVWWTLKRGAMTWVLPQWLCLLIGEGTMDFVVGGGLAALLVAAALRLQAVRQRVHALLPALRRPAAVAAHATGNLVGKEEV